MANGKLPGLKCADPNGLMLFEWRDEEMVGGIILMAFQTQKFNQIDVVPKWRVVAVGDNVEKDIGVTAGDLVIIHRTAGRLREVQDDISVRLVHKSDVLAKVVVEPLVDYADFIKAAFKQR